MLILTHGKAYIFRLQIQFSDLLSDALYEFQFSFLVYN